MFQVGQNVMVKGRYVLGLTNSNKCRYSGQIKKITKVITDYGIRLYQLEKIQTLFREEEIMYPICVGDTVIVTENLDLLCSSIWSQSIAEELRGSTCTITEVRQARNMDTGFTYRLQTTKGTLRKFFLIRDLFHTCATFKVDTNDLLHLLSC